MCDAGDHCGEAPLWLDDRGTLAWADQGRGFVYALAGDEARVVAEGFGAAGLARTEDGSLIVAGPDGLARLPEGGALQRLPLADLRGACLNDICAGPGGELLAGTMTLSRADGFEVSRPGALVRIEAGGRVRELDADLLLPNGMGLSPDERWLYVVDSGRRQILAYPADRLEHAGPRRRVVAELSRDDGVPDGLAVDAAGDLWVAMWYGGQILCYSPAGELKRRVRVPFAQVSSLAFGGETGRDLYVTTARTPCRSASAPAGWSPRQVQGGPLLRVRIGVAGHLRRRVRAF